MSGVRSRALWLGLCALAASGGAGAGERIITIDGPGTGSSAPQDTGCFAGTDCSVLINRAGAVTGYYLDASDVYHGFVRSPEGRFTSFDAPGADTAAGDYNGTLPNAINDAGAITGVYYDVNNLGHGFLRSPDGRFTSFDVPGGTPGTINPVALNLEGAAVGYYEDANGVFQAFLRRADGKVVTWAGPGACDATPAAGCYGTAAFGINEAGTVAGGYEDAGGNFVNHGLVRSREGAFTSFGAPAAGLGPYQGTGSPGSSVAINRSGAIAGYFIDANNVVHGYLRSPSGSITTFDVPDAGPYGIGCYADCSIGLNDRGAITGSYLDANNVYRGFVRSPEGRFTSFDAPAANTAAGAFSGTFPMSINAAGDVTGTFYDANNVGHAFLRPASGED